MSSQALHYNLKESSYFPPVQSQSRLIPAVTVDRHLSCTTEARRGGIVGVNFYGRGTPGKRQLLWESYWWKPHDPGPRTLVLLRQNKGSLFAVAIVKQSEFCLDMSPLLKNKRVA